MILHWDQVALHYGHGRIEIKRGQNSGNWLARDYLAQYKKKYLRAENATYGFLFSPVSFEEIEMTQSGGGKHAEENLMATKTWNTDIPVAIDNAFQGYSDTFNVILGINRTPCGNCTNLLVEKLAELHRRFPRRVENARFILASLGAYRPNETRPDNPRTAIKDLTLLKKAGWELCVLQTGDRLTQNGRVLHETLENLGQRGILRLDNH